MPVVHLCVQLYSVHRLCTIALRPVKPVAQLASRRRLRRRALYSPVVYHFILVRPPELVYCILCCAAPTVARHTC
jgi:hypothetical protein